eukprot:gene7729-7558_t
MNQAYAILGTNRLHAYIAERAGHVYYFAIESAWLSSAPGFNLPFVDVLPDGPLHVGDAIYLMHGADYSVALIIEGGSVRLLCNDQDVLKDYLIGLDLQIVEIEHKGGKPFTSIPQAIQGITERFINDFLRTNEIERKSQELPEFTLKRVPVGKVVYEDYARVLARLSPDVRVVANRDSIKIDIADPSKYAEFMYVINGMKITEMELGGMLQSGVDRAIVIDRYINKVVAAERGREMYVEEAKAALRAAEREVLSTLYTTKRMDELRKAVSDDDVKAYYDANVLDQNFQQWKVSYYLSNDQNDVQQTLDKLKKGDKDALDQLKPLVEQGDGYAVAQAMPYNLGRVVSKMKKGEFSEVLRLRNGLL